MDKKATLCNIGERKPGVRFPVNGLVMTSQAAVVGISGLLTQAFISLAECGIEMNRKYQTITILGQRCFNWVPLLVFTFTAFLSQTTRYAVVEIDKL